MAKLRFPIQELAKIEMLKYTFIGLLLFVSVIAVAQPQQQQRIRINIEKADFLRHDDKIGRNTQSLNGNVILTHGRTWLYCDSAYMYNDSNFVVCYGSVHAIQNDSIHLYGDLLEYDGDKNLAKLRKNVRANKGNTWLYTEFLDYDRLNDVGYYFNGGRMVNNDNVMTSEHGYYYPNTNEAFFKDTVVVVTPEYHIDSDTLKYNTVTDVVGLLGPTTIVNSDSTVIYSEDGWYDTQKDRGELLKNSVITSTDKILKGKKIFYDRRLGLGKVWQNMQLIDTLNNMTMFGDYGFFNERTKEALATQNAQLLQIYGTDSLFMHADTFRIVPLPQDSSRLIKAFHNVKFFRFDLQGRCDSLVFDFRDSIATMYHLPIVWAQGNQLTAQEIKLYTKNQVLYKSELINAAFAISPDDSVGYNQVKGKMMTGYIRNNELYKIDVDGNGQTIYYPKDGEAVIGVNRAESSNLSIFFQNKKVSNIVMRVSPTGNMNPPLLLKDDDVKLSGFRWLDDYRPKSKSDIFLKLDIPIDMMVMEEVYEGYTFDDISVE